MAKLAPLISFLLILGILQLQLTLWWIIHLDTWTQDKKFVVGDVLLFQYTSSESVNQVTKEAFDGCSTTNVLKTHTNGNTTVTLSRPGAWYFVSGNKLYCLGGMKLQVNVQGNQADSPVPAPQAQSGATDLPQPASKNNNLIPTSAGFIDSGKDSLVKAFLGFFATVL